MKHGKYYRIWPNIDPNRRELLVSVALARPFARPVCKLLVSEDYGMSHRVIADFYSMNKRNTTTGQPFITSDGVILLPTWSASFYTHGETWFAIYRSEDRGASWKKVYEDSRGTYAKHFFQDSADGTLYIGVGVDGGGSEGRISYKPARSYLLRSVDHGTTWTKILKVDYPTALYDGIALENKMILVMARDKRSMFRSVDTGNSWTEISLGAIPRNSSYLKDLDKMIISSDSTVFVSDNGFEWMRLDTPIKWLILRYPNLNKARIHMTSAGPHSYVMATDLNKWYLVFDTTHMTGSNTFTRMTVFDDYIFLGNELNGVLLRVLVSNRDYRPMTTAEFFECNAKVFFQMGKYVVKRILHRSSALD